MLKGLMLTDEGPVLSFGLSERNVEALWVGRPIIGTLAGRPDQRADPRLR